MKRQSILVLVMVILFVLIRVNSWLNILNYSAPSFDGVYPELAEALNKPKP